MNGNMKLALILTLTLVWGSWNPAAAEDAAKAPEKSKPSSKDLFLVGPSQAGAGASAPAVTPAVKFWTERENPEGKAPAKAKAAAKKTTSGRDIILDTRPVFRSGDRVWLCFQANVDCYAYLLCEGSSGEITLLYPGAAGKDNKVPARTQKVMPSVGIPFQFDENPGIEKLALLVSPQRLEKLETVANQSRADGGTPEMKKALDEYRDKNGAAKNARDLVLQQDSEPADQETPGNYVADQGAGGFTRPIPILMELRHEP